MAERRVPKAANTRPQAATENMAERASMLNVGKSHSLSTSIALSLADS